MKLGVTLLAFALCIALATAHVFRSGNRMPYQPKGSANVTQHWGYINVDSQYDANVFFWLFESQNDPSSDPLILWLTGGPGCSSMLALLFENGPYTVSSQKTLVPNPYSWNKNATVMWVDQPVGTGFSYAKTDYIHDEAQVQQEMATFLTAFFQKYPQYASLDFYVTGESYGGHYVPAVASYIVQNVTSVNFKGAAIGNGWISPITQYGAYGPFAYENQLISQREYASMNSTYAKCKALLQKQEWTAAEFVCSSIMQTVLNANPGLNYYNIKTQCDPPPLCYDLTDITDYLNDPTVQKHLGVNVKWEACNDEVNGNFVPIDEEESFSSDIPIILAAGHPVMLYNGMLDLICNYVGGLEVLESMSWSGQSTWNSVPLSQWTVAGQAAGYYKTSSGLTFVEVANAGHMVPHDQGANALALINSFIYGTPFSS